MRKEAIILAITAGALLWSSASAGAPAPPQSEQADALLREIAARTIHGSRDDALTPEARVRQYLEGKKLHLTCGPVVTLARDLLARAGVRSRMVATITRGPYERDGNGHTMLEVRLWDRWVVYDLDGNRQPVDARGEGVSILRLLRMRDPGWKLLASDPLYDAEPLKFSTVKSWYERAFGVPLIEQSTDEFVFHDPGQRKRIEHYARRFSQPFRFVSRNEWRRTVAGL